MMYQAKVRSISLIQNGITSSSSSSGSDFGPRHLRQEEGDRVADDERERRDQRAGPDGLEEDAPVDRVDSTG